MVRGFVFLLGLLVLFIGVTDKAQFKEVATTPSEVSADEAVAIVAKDDEAYVRIKSSLEDKKIYSATVSSPRYTACSRDAVLPISAQSDRAGLLGCHVKLSGKLEPRQVEVVSVRQKRLQKDEEKGRYLIAPVTGTQLNLWVLSPFFEGSNASSTQGWAAQGQYQGVLTKLSDLNDNRAGLQKKVDELKAFFQHEYSAPVPEDALLVIDSENEGSAYDNFGTGGAFYYVPVAGSARAVYLAVSNQASPPATIEGVLKPEPRDKFVDFKNALGTEIPARIGIITQWTGEARNATKRQEGTENVIIGLVIIGLAIVMTYVKKLFRRRKSAAKAGT